MGTEWLAIGGIAQPVPSAAQLCNGDPNDAKQTQQVVDSVDYMES